jgi:hypothetical protein
MTHQSTSLGFMELPEIQVLDGEENGKGHRHSCLSTSQGTKVSLPQ